MIFQESKPLITVLEINNFFLSQLVTTGYCTETSEKKKYLATMALILDLQTKYYRILLLPKGYHVSTFGEYRKSVSTT
jgi:hypothetical protein